MRISKLLTDTVIMQELGARLCQIRIQLDITQAQLAEQAGISKRTLERLEDGASTQLSTWIRVLRILDLLPGLETAIPHQEPGPMELLTSQSQSQSQNQSKPRRRASGASRSGRDSNSKTGHRPRSTSSWKWKDEA